MSKFIDRLKQVSQPPPPPMGFGAAKNVADRPKIQLVASPGNAAAALVNQLSMVDAVLVTAARKNVSEKNWGLWLKKGDAGEVEQSIKSQADFVVLPADGAVLTSDTKIGKVLQIETDITDILLRAANELSVDAFLLDHDKNGALTWQKLMEFYRFGGLLNKPVLVTVPATVTATDLQNIWEAGISGVIVEVGDEAAVASLTKIREIIDGLPFPAKKRKDKMSPTLPQMSAPTGDEGEEPDEEPDDDD